VVEELLRTEGLKVAIPTLYGVVRAVNGVSIKVRSGEAVAIVGESGCGKTMTALSLMRLLPFPGEITDGHIYLNGRDLVPIGEDEMRLVRGREMGMVFQDPMTYLNPLMRVGEQITEALRFHHGLTERQARAQAIEALKLVRVPTPDRILGTYPHQLSGGMRQRVLIAIAISSRPALLIADEPTTALDVTIQAQIMQLLIDLRRELGNALLLITHDLGLVAEYCDRVYVMYAGEIVEEADIFSIFASPQHPYAQALLKNTMSVDRRLNAFETIQGQPPSLIDPPPGCRFHPRCPLAMEKCRVAVPPRFEVGSGRTAACWLRENATARIEP